MTYKEQAQTKLLSERMERNFIHQFRDLSAVDGATFAETDLIAKYSCGVDTDWMNGVLRVDGNCADLEKLVLQTLQEYSYPMLWRIGSLTTNPHRVRKVLLANNLKPEPSEIGMVLNRGEYASYAPLSELQVKHISKPDDISDWLIPFAEAFEMKPDVVNHYRLVMQSRVGRVVDEGWLIGYVRGTPVTTLSYLTDSEVTVLCNVGTLVEHRKRGYARRLVEALIDHLLKVNDFPICLYATELGISLYGKMGFEPICTREHYVFDPRR